MDWRELFVKYLKKDLHRKQSINPSYSIRRYALRLGLSGGTLSELLNGKRKMSRARALKVIERIELSERERRKILSFMGEEIVIQRQLVDPKNFDVLMDWRSLAIVGLCEAHGVDRSVRGLAARLMLDEEYVETKIKEFLKRGLLVQLPDQTFGRPREDWRLDGNIPVEVANRAHEEVLTLSKHVLKWIPPDKREFKSLRFTGTKSQFEILKKEIAKLFDRCSALSEEELKDQLYCISVQLFPFEFNP